MSQILDFESDFGQGNRKAILKKVGHMKDFAFSKWTSRDPLTDHRQNPSINGGLGVHFFL